MTTKRTNIPDIKATGMGLSRDGHTFKCSQAMSSSEDEVCQASPNFDFSPVACCEAFFATWACKNETEQRDIHVRGIRTLSETRHNMTLA